MCSTACIFKVDADEPVIQGSAVGVSPGKIFNSFSKL